MPADEIVGSIGVAFEGDYSALADDFATAVQMASDAGQKMAAALNDAFSSVSLTIPPDSISMGSIAADLAQEIAQAFANTPINLNLSTETATSAAADVAQEIAGAFQNTPINLNIAPVDDSAAVAAAQEIAGAFGQISIPAPNTDEFVAGLDALKGPLADVTGTTIDWTGVLDALNKSLDDTGSSAADQTGSIAALEASMAAADEAAQNYAGSAEEIRQKQQDADDALSDARTALQEIIDAYGRGEASENELATATANVESAFQKANPAIHDSGAAAEEAGTKLGTMGEQLLALGEALAITEGLKEFGKEALTAADNVTRTTIALTALTGDGDAAKETIEKLEALGISDGLAFPSLLEAGQRMQAMLGDAVEVPGELEKIANAAAAMNTDIGSAASMFDRMASAGTANARSMIALGINMSDLATAMGVTEGEAAKAFKALDVADRIDVLNTAMSKFDGIAQDVAKNTFSGSWTVLANQWDSVMVEIGKDIMPVVTGLMSLISTDVLPFIKSLADDFGALPAPVKDVAVGLGLAVVALVPIGGLLVAASLGFNQITQSLTTLGIITPEAAAETSVLAAAQEALSATAGTATEAEGTLALAEGEVGAAAAESGGAVAGFAAETSGAATVAGSLTLGVGVLATAFGAIALNVGGSARAVADFFNTAGVNVGDVLLGWATGANAADVAFKSVTDSQKILADEAASDAAAHDKLTGSVKATAQSTGDLFDKMLAAQSLLEEMDAAYKNNTATANDLVWALKNLNDAQDKWNASMHEDVGVQAVSDQYNKLNDAVIQAKTTLEILQVDDDGTAASHAKLAIAAADVTKAQQALNAALGDSADSLKAYTALADSTNAILAKLPDTYGEYVQKLDDGGTAASNSIKAISAEIDKLSTKMDSMPQHAAQLQSLIDNLETARAKAQQFADQDEFAKIGTQISDLDSKVNGIKPDLLNLFNSVLADLDQIPGSVAKNGQELIKWLHQAQQEQDKLDQQTQKTQKTLDTAYLKYIDATQNQAIPITADLAQRLGNVDTTFQSTDTHVSDAASSLANYVGAVGRLKLGYDGLTDSQHQIIGDFDTITSNANSSWQMVDDAFNKASGAFKTLAQSDLPAVIDAETRHTQALIDKKAPYDAIITSITDEDKYISQVAKTDLPAAIAMYQQEIEKLQQIPGSYQAIQHEEQNMLNAEITLAHLRGQDASDYLIALDQLKQKMSGSGTDSLYHAYQDIQQINKDTFNQLSGAFSSIITQGGTVQDALIKAFKNIAGTITNDLMHLALEPLQNSLKQLIDSQFPGIKSGMADLSQGAGTFSGALATSTTHLNSLTGAAGDSVTQLGSLTGNAGECTTSIGTLTGSAGSMDGAMKGATSSLGSFASSLSSFVDSGVLGAIAGIGISVLTSAFSPGAPKAPTSTTAQMFYESGVQLNNPQTQANVQRIFGISPQDMAQIVAQFDKLSGIAQGGTTAAKATGDQITEAISNIKGDISALQAKEETLNNALTIAISTNDTTTAAQISANIKSLESQVKTDQEYLAAIQALQQSIAASTAAVGPDGRQNTDSTNQHIDSVGKTISDGVDRMGRSSQETASAVAAAVSVATKQQGEAAITAQQQVIDGLKAKEAELTSQWIEAMASGDKALADSLYAQIQSLNGTISQQTGILTQLQGAVTDIPPNGRRDAEATQQHIDSSGQNVSDSVDHMGRQVQEATSTASGSINDTITQQSTANAQQITDALANAQKAVDDLKQKEADLNQQLIIAEAQNKSDVVASLLAQIGTTNSDLTAAQNLLSEIKTSTGQIAQNTSYIAQATNSLSFTFGKATDAATQSAVLLELLQKDLQLATTDLTNATANGTAAQIEAAATTKNAIVEAITALQNDKTVPSAIDDLQKQLTANDDSMARASGAQLQALTDAHNAIVGAINLLSPYNQQTATATTQTAANTSTGNLVSPLQAALASGNIALATQILNSNTGTASTTTAVTQLPSAIGSAVGSAVGGVVSAGGPGVMTTPGFIPGGTGPAGSPFGLTRIPLEQLYTALGLTPPDDVSGKFVPYNYMGGAMGLGQQASQFFGTGVPTYASVGIQQAGQLKYSYPINVVSAGTGVAILCANPDGTISTIFDWKGEHATDASFVPPPSDVWNAMMSAGNVATADDQARQTWAQRVADAVKSAASTGTPYTPPNPVTGQGGGTNPPPTTGTGNFNPISSGAPPPPLVPPPLPTPILPGSGTPPPVIDTGGGTGGGTPPFVPPIGPFGPPPPGTGNPFGPIQTPPTFVPPSGAEGPPPPGTGDPLYYLHHPPPSTTASADATTAAVKELTSTISGLQGQANSLQNQLINAVATGDQASITAINSQLSSVNSQISSDTSLLATINASINAAAAKQLDATIESMKGSKATTDQISTAIGNEQTILKGYQDQQAQLQQDLIQAVASGNTDLVTEIQKQQSTIAGEIQATQSLLSAVGGSAATGTGTFAASSSVSGGGSSNTLVGGTSFSSASYSGGGGTSGTSASGTFNISAGTLLLSLGDLAGQASVSDSIAQLIHQSTVGAVPKGAVNAFTQMISAGQVYLEMRVGSVYASSGVGALIAAAGIPSFDVGGYVPRDMVAQLHAGETVIPPGGAGSGNISVVINVSGSGNPRQVATEIMANLKRVSPRFAMAAS